MFHGELNFTKFNEPKMQNFQIQFNKNIYKRVTLDNHSQWFSTLWYLEIKACLDIFICWLVFMKINILIDILDIETKLKHFSRELQASSMSQFKTKKSWIEYHVWKLSILMKIRGTIFKNELIALYVSYNSGYW